MVNEMKEDVLMISVTKDILVVARKTPGETFDIVNAFQGEEAFALYEKLTTMVRKEETENESV